MTECQIAKSCPFYTGKAQAQPTSSGFAAVSKWLRSNYCKGNFSMCARNTVVEAMGQEYLPADLFPNEQARAVQLISQANRLRGGIRKVT